MEKLTNIENEKDWVFFTNEVNFSETHISNWNK